MTVRYEIDSDNAVKVYYGDAEIPSLYQPHWPNGEAWADAAESEDWAKLYLASVTDDAAPYAPGARGEEGRPKPTPEEIAAMQAQFESRRNPAPISE